MDLTSEQKQQVSQWIGDGSGLSEVQERLSKEFGLSMTYMDVRFLVDDLNLDLQDPGGAEEEADEEGEAAPAADANAELVGGALSVEVAKVQRPGAVVSGSVTFSDGITATWQIDQMGRLGIVPPTEGYKPSDEDMAEFQQALQRELQSKGF